MKITLLVIFTGLLFAANAQSITGDWSKKDKKLAKKAVKAVEKDLEVLGDNKQPYIDCYLEKIENNYSSFRAADSDVEGCANLAKACATEILGIGGEQETGNGGAEPSKH